MVQMLCVLARLPPLLHTIDDSGSGRAGALCSAQNCLGEGAWCSIPQVSLSPFHPIASYGDAPAWEGGVFNLEVALRLHRSLPL